MVQKLDATPGTLAGGTPNAYHPAMHGLGIVTTQDMHSFLSCIFLSSWQSRDYTLAKEYFEQLDAPVKEFYTFEQSAHSPISEEPEKVQRILLQDVLSGTNKLAD